MDTQERLLRQLPGLNPEEQVEVIIKYHGSLANIAQSLSAEAEELNENYAIIVIPVYKLPQLLTINEVEFYELPKTLTFQLRRSLNLTGVTNVQQERGYNLNGAGVLVGIIDSGIDYTHPDFRTSDGKTRILYMWDQNAEGSPPHGFISGHLYTKEDIDLALTSDDPAAVVPEVDNLGHGTAVAGVAAGNGRSSNGEDSGVAPQAGIVVVKLKEDVEPGFARSTAIMRGVKFCIDMAVGLEMPIAINISYGTNDGAHNGTSLFEGYLDSASTRWKTVICVAAGNERSAGHHYYGVIVQNATQSIEYSIGENIRQLYLTFWKNFADTFEIELISPSGQSSGVISAVNRATRVVLDNVRVTVLFGMPTHYNFSQEIYITMEGIGGPMRPEIWRLTVKGIIIVDGRINIWLPMTDMVTEKTAFLVPNPENTLSIPATAFSVISVGAYSGIQNTCAFFSGRGLPYIVYGQKPDLIAPGDTVLTTSVGRGYDTFTGTSISAPFVTGAAALMMEWGIVRQNDVFLFGQKVKAFLCRNANRTFPVSYPNSSWGYGLLDLIATMDNLILYRE